MGVKAEKTLDESKHDIVISTVATGAATGPTNFHVAVYTMVDTVDNKYRQVEIVNRLKEIVNKIREDDYGRPSSGTAFWRVPLKEPKSNIVRTAIATEIVTGDVAVGLSGNVIGNDRGNLLITSAFHQIIDWMREQDRLVA